MHVKIASMLLARHVQCPHDLDRRPSPAVVTVAVDRIGKPTRMPDGRNLTMLGPDSAEFDAGTTNLGLLFLMTTQVLTDSLLPPTSYKCSSGRPLSQTDVTPRTQAALYVHVSRTNGTRKPQVEVPTAIAEPHSRQPTTHSAERGACRRA